MKPADRCAVILLGIAAAALILTIAGVGAGALALIGASAAPIAVGAALCGRLRRPAPWRALLVGGGIGVLVFLLTEPLVDGFVALFVQGFADSGRQLIQSLQIDPRLATVLASPWVLVLLITMAAVAPLTEEAGKALGAGLAGPQSREEAFLFGAWAGVGFALVENLVYAGIGMAAGHQWPMVAVSRSIGAAANPLATGLVMLGWWQWRRERRVITLVRGYLSGVGVNALWNGTTVVLGVVVAALAVGGPSKSLEYAVLVYNSVLGVVLAVALWVVAGAVAAGRDPLLTVSLRSARSVAMVSVLGASLLVPLAVLVIAFPGFYLGS
jgi:RsiW-degrading membrane proteinase PrsW (M82 family)